MRPTMMMQRLVNDLARGRIQLALIPVAPILLLPFIIVGFVIGFPLWVISLAVLGILRLIAWPIDKGLAAAGKTFQFGPYLRRAFNWVKTFGGLAGRLEKRPVPGPGVTRPNG